MSDLKLGQVIEGDQHKDAIHIAVAPVVAATALYPGQRIGFVHGSTEKVRAVKSPIGIVDPFLKLPVQPGQKFWMFLFPNTITALRHEWTHPAFDAQPSKDTPEKAEAMIWMIEFAQTKGLSYEELMGGAKGHIEHDEWLCDGDKWDGNDDVPAEFWAHYEILTGTEVPDDKQHSFFSCSC